MQHSTVARAVGSVHAPMLCLVFDMDHIGSNCWIVKLQSTIDSSSPGYEIFGMGGSTFPPSARVFIHSLGVIFILVFILVFHLFLLFRLHPRLHPRLRHHSCLHPRFYHCQDPCNHPRLHPRVHSCLHPHFYRCRDLCIHPRLHLRLHSCF